jgi:acyl carrier protein
MQTNDQMFATLRDTLVELFELEPERISPSARLYEDLEIDSIDAIDLIDQMRRRTGKKISAEDFRSVRSVQDVLDAMHRLSQAA